MNSTNPDYELLLLWRENDTGSYLRTKSGVEMFVEGVTRENEREATIRARTSLLSLAREGREVTPESWLRVYQRTGLCD